tara:strand:- start:193 stop:573 length:381 start_codon:yes stop_codon:yes gene_type:complete
MIQKQFKSLLIQELEIENMRPLSLYYNRYVNHETSITDVKVDEIKQKCNLHGIIYEPNVGDYVAWQTILHQQMYRQGGAPQKQHNWTADQYFATKEDLIAAMKETKDVVVKKSWKKEKLLNALMSY